MTKQHPLATNREEGRFTNLPATMAHQVDIPADEGNIVWKNALAFVGILAALSVLVVFGGWLSGGKSGAEKTIIRLVQPVGALWLLYTSWCIQFYGRPLIGLPRSMRARIITPADNAKVCGPTKNSLRTSIVPAITWLAFVVFTTSPLCNWCVGRLESSVVSFQPEANPPLDAIVVLGGGTHQGPWRAEVSAAGDRVVYAAQLYLQGHARRLITTGDASPGISKDLTSPREQTIELWTRLDIPVADIGTLNGKNTFQELQSLKDNWSQFESGRVGILTSAMHLPRAMRLAKSQGLDVLPVAADHLYTDQPLTYLDFIPSAGPPAVLAVCQHEFMAWLVNR